MSYMRDLSNLEQNYQIYMSSNKRHYRIINDTNTLPNSLPCPFSNMPQLQNLAKSLIKEKKFMYIDINEEQGFKLMKECESSDEDDEVEKIGKKYLVNLNNLHTKNSKGINYIYRYKQQGKKKDHALQLLKEELKRSTEKIELIGKAKPNSSANSSNLYNDRPFLERYISIKSANDKPTSMQKSPLRPSPNLNKTTRYYQTISYDKAAAMTKSQTPKKREKDAASYTMRNVLPDIKRVRRNIRI